MRKELLIALRVTAVTLVLTGLLYPLVITGLAQVLFPHRAGRQLSHRRAGRVVGSELIGQGFSAPGLLPPASLGCRQGRLGRDGAPAGTNLGPTSKKLRDRRPRRSQGSGPRTPERQARPRWSW